MNSIDFSPLYRSSVGFDRLASLLDQSLQHNQASSGYPPYNIELVDENRYTITLAVAGFEERDLDLNVEKGTLTVKGTKQPDEKEHQFLYQGIATRGFERKFNLADYVEVKGASLTNGMLTIDLVKEIPEAMKPRRIDIKTETAAIEHKAPNKGASKVA
ncbi:Hsp20 family protein [Motiliproteus sp. MSK22-1]|uniref:Hsp20 family protein n=1 Tax=Motiliproteus sp. MSK22-1 TaxID=1897630 RepID=UPI000976F549|nr:Hsp20 family protein [Motiliproteus sp. MSK22-1]OMH25553.1 heat-shock protein [Motiliproteus sp. MSK22-1]